MRPALHEGDEIREARGEDLPMLAAIELQAAARFRSLGIEGAFLGETQLLDDLARAGREARLWVAASDGRCVGFAVARRLEDDEAWLEEVDVLPDHGRRGLGRALVERAIAWAREGGARSMALATFRDVPWNAPFYARLGFREVTPPDVSPSIRRLVQEERARGLPMDRRLVMRLRLAPNEEQR